MLLGYLLKLLTRGVQKISSVSTETSVSIETSHLSTKIHSPKLTTSEDTAQLLHAVTVDNLLPTTSDQAHTPVPKIVEDKFMINVSMLQDELQNFVSGTSDIQGAALVSPDGLALASVLPGGMDEERTAAMSASMLSLGERIGRELARGNVERIVVEGEKGYGVLVGCGSDAVLLVLANAGVKQGLLFLEVKRAVSRIAPLLA
ncbi:MAG: roadblock/LC7 domain-containing protein [Fischerella sp. CENA71]|nr:roadblock/LC7 domain-containing protein [Fischerella sp. CENA71]